MRLFARWFLFAKSGGGIVTEFHFAAFRICFRFAANFLIRSFEGAQAAHLLEDALGIEFVLEALERPVNWFALADNNFWHSVLLGKVFENCV